MNTIHSQLASEIEARSIRATAAFLEDRLETRAAVDWALGLSEGDALKRRAVLHLLEGSATSNLRDPWLSAWRLMEESWRLGLSPDSSVKAYQAQNRLRAGDRSGTLIDFIVDLVSPRLEITKRATLRDTAPNPRVKPRSVFDLLTATITSGPVFDPGILELDRVDELHFLLDLASGLEAALSRGLGITRRLGWQATGSMWRLLDIYRVYYVSDGGGDSKMHDPDITHTGLAPSAKVLSAVLKRLTKLHPPTVTKLIRPWRGNLSPIHLRLWAAAVMDSKVESGRQIGQVLIELGDSEFWQAARFPEVAELRALRFVELTSSDKVAIIGRILRAPPKRLWPKTSEPRDVREAQDYLRGQELRRISLAGAELPEHGEEVLGKALQCFPDLLEMVRIDYGFLEFSTGAVLPQAPDNTFDRFVGVERLEHLETTLKEAARGLRDDPAGAALTWIRSPSRTHEILTDFEGADNGGSGFPSVWEQFGWAHRPQSMPGGPLHGEGERAHAIRVLNMVLQLDQNTITLAIDGISAWMASWSRQIAETAEGIAVWRKVWPLAVAATDSMQVESEEPRLDVVAEGPRQDSPLDLDTLNTPVGSLVGYFLQMCPNLNTDPAPFQSREDLRGIRDQIVSTTGRSGLISLHRLIEHIGYFARADSEWTERHLFAKLRNTNGDELPLWRAVARRGPGLAVIRLLGSEMGNRALDARLDRETRGVLTFRLVIDSLYALKNNETPAVLGSRLQQIIRLLEDELRARAASAVTRFVKDLSSSKQGQRTDHSPEGLFRTAARPFLDGVWPQETSLATPGVSNSLSELPAASGQAFAEAVAVIRRYLVPFDCWSLVDYGLWGDVDGVPRLAMIDSEEKAGALLDLFNLTIGLREGAVVPYGLGDALKQIEDVQPQLVRDPRFRRLATVARRL